MKSSLISGGMTKLLQTLDIAVNRSFKYKPREKCNILMAEDNHEYTKAVAIKKALYDKIYFWIKESRDEVVISCI